MSVTVPFRRSREERAELLADFASRAEIEWFGFTGAYQEGVAVVTLKDANPAHAGGGGTAEALNGGMIAAGFDASAVLAAQGHFESRVATISLAVNFLSPALTSAAPRWVARAIRTTRDLAFIEMDLETERHTCATASAIMKRLA